MLNRYAAKYAEPGAQVRVRIIYDFTSPRHKPKTLCDARCLFCRWVNNLEPKHPIDQTRRRFYSLFHLNIFYVRIESLIRATKRKCQSSKDVIISTTITSQMLYQNKTKKHKELVITFNISGAEWVQISIKPQCATQNTSSSLSHL